MDPFKTDIVDRLLAVLLGLYFMAVFFQGNAGKLGNEVKSEKRYLEFLVAIFIIYYAVKYDKSGIVAPLIVLGGLGMALKFGGFLGSNELSSKFANGQIGLFDYITQSFSRR